MSVFKPGLFKGKVAIVTGKLYVAFGYIIGRFSKTYGTYIGTSANFTVHSSRKD
jgi:hypothetical protein